MITAVSSPGAAFQGLPFRNAIAPEILTILLEKDKEDKRGAMGAYWLFIRTITGRVGPYDEDLLYAGPGRALLAQDPPRLSSPLSISPDQRRGAPPGSRRDPVSMRSTTSSTRAAAAMPVAP